MNRLGLTRKLSIGVAIIFVLVVSASCTQQPVVMSDSPSTQQLVVLSDSMEPTIMAGDCITIRETDGLSLQVGEVIAFHASIGGEGVMLAHRICDVTYNEDGSVAYYYTKGDNNDLVDQDPFNMYCQDPVLPDQVIGVWMGY